MADNPTVALLGTGIMGAGMARNILAAVLPLWVWNRTQERAPLEQDLAEAAARRYRRVVEAAHGDHDMAAAYLASVEQRPGDNPGGGTGTSQPPLRRRVHTGRHANPRRRRRPGCA